MPRYVLSIMQPDGPPPAPEVLGPIMAGVQKVLADAKSSGAYVFNAGLTAADAATVVRANGNGTFVTDGPYIEAKEHVGGFVIVRAADRAGALDWATRLAKVITLPIEVRQMHGEE